MAQTHVVDQGEYLSLIAKKYGFRDWRIVYDHPKNAAFKRARPNPHVIYPGDRIYIPDKDQKSEACVTTKTHVFKLGPQAKTMLRIVLKEHQSGQILAGVDCTLKIGDLSYLCKTDGTGLLQQEIPDGFETAELSVKKYKLKWQLQIGHLDPVEDSGESLLTGIQGRLNNLGYHCGAVDGIMGPKTKAALQRFQRKVMQQEVPDGEPDEDTRRALETEHLC